MTLEVWKKKLTECESYLMEIVDKEMETKGDKVTIQHGCISQIYILHHDFYDHKAMISFDIINRRWVSALIYCIEPISIDRDPPEFVQKNTLQREQPVDWKIEFVKKFKTDECLDRLVGKKIIKLLFNSEKNSFAFLLDTLRLEVFYCKGECCSNSWIEHVSGLNTLFQGKVNKIKYIDIDTERKGDEYGEKETLIYRFDIYTEGGICSMEMRNHSNGYYCGQLTHADDDVDNSYYGDEFVQPTIECKEDF